MSPVTERAPPPGDPETLAVYNPAMHARWILATAVAAALAAAARPAAAQSPEVTVDGNFNVGYSRFTQDVFEADPNADAEDRPDTSSDRAFTEVRPGIAIQSGRARLYWRLGYQLSGNFAINGGSPAYSNQGDLAMFALPSKHTSLTVNAIFAQGGTSFLLNQRAADAGSAEVIAPGSPNLISASLNETLSWDLGRQFVIRQGLSGSLSAPQDLARQFNGALTASLGLDRVFQRFSAGLEARSTASRLRQLTSTTEPVYYTVTNSFLVRFNHDFTYRWNGLATAGVEQVYSGTGSEPLALLPSASVVAVYSHGDTSGALELSHGTFTNIQVGTISVSDRIAVRGGYMIDAQKLRTLSFSTGFLHNEPIGEAETRIPAVTGNVIQADLGFSTAFTKHILGNARYTYTYQFGLGAGLEPLTAHIFTIGVTGRYSNTEKLQRPLPGRGRRVDGSDAKGFPAGGDPVDRPDDAGVMR